MNYLRPTLQTILYAPKQYSCLINHQNIIIKADFQSVEFSEWTESLLFARENVAMKLNGWLCWISTRRKNFEAEKLPAIQFPADQTGAAEKYRAANSRNTFYFSRLDIFPPNGDPALWLSNFL